MLVILSDHLLQRSLHTHASCLKSIQVPLGQPRLCAERRPYIIVLHSAAAAEQAQGLDAALTLPESRGLVDHLGFPKIRVARETWSRRQSREGWMTQSVSSSVSWLLLAFSNCLPTRTVESTSLMPQNFSLMMEVNHCVWQKLSELAVDSVKKRCSYIKSFIITTVILVKMLLR